MYVFAVAYADDGTYWYNKDYPLRLEAKTEPSDKVSVTCTFIYILHTYIYLLQSTGWKGKIPGRDKAGQRHAPSRMEEALST